MAPNRSSRFAHALGVFLAGVSCTRAAESDPVPRVASIERQDERRRMVDDQIAARGITDARVLAAMGAVPRHLFVPSSMRAYAYEDRPLPIGFEQTISQPYIVALMTEALAIGSDETVLEIGTGSGYQAAVLAELAGAVYTIEIVEPLAARARETLSNRPHVHVRHGDGYRGWAEAGPFDAIIVTAAPESVPEPLLEQLAMGGRMIVPVGRKDQELILIERGATGLERRSILPVRFVPMTGESRGN